MKYKNESIERILLLRLSAMGDCIVAMPVFNALRERFPKAHIAWAIQDNFAPLLESLPGLDEVIVFPRQRWKRMPSRWLQIREALRVARHLRLRRFQVTVDVQSNTKSAMLAFLTRAPLRIGHGVGEAKELSPWLNNRRIVAPQCMEHIIERNLNLLSALEIPMEEPKFNLPVHPVASRRIHAWLAEKGIEPGSFAALFPFCGGAEKEWRGEHYATLAEGLARAGMPVLFGCAPGEEERARRLMPDSEYVCLGPRTSLPELVELVRNAGVCVGGDTGPLQIAGALGTASIALFGPTDPARSHPWQNCRVYDLHELPSLIEPSVLSTWRGRSL